MNIVCRDPSRASKEKEADLRANRPAYWWKLIGCNHGVMFGQIPVGTMLKDPACQGNEMAEWKPGLSQWFLTNGWKQMLWISILCANYSSSLWCGQNSIQENRNYVRDLNSVKWLMLTPPCLRTHQEISLCWSTASFLQIPNLQSIHKATNLAEHPGKAISSFKTHLNMLNKQFCVFYGAYYTWAWEVLNNFLVNIHLKHSKLTF